MQYFCSDVLYKQAKIKTNETNSKEDQILRLLQAINANAKRFLKDKFETWYCKQTTKGLESGADVHTIDVNTNLSVMKPIHANWIISFYDHMRNQEEISQDVVL